MIKQKDKKKTEVEEIIEYLISKGARELTEEEKKEESYINFKKELQAEERKQKKRKTNNPATQTRIK